MCIYGDVQILVRGQSPRQTSWIITRMMLIMMRTTMTTVIFVLMIVMYYVQVPVPVPSSSITATSLPVRLIANYRTKVLLLPCKSLFSFSCHANFPFPSLAMLISLFLLLPCKSLFSFSRRANLSFPSLAMAITLFLLTEWRFLVHDINIEAPLKHLILINKRIYFELSSVGYLAKLALRLHKGAGL